MKQKQLIHIIGCMTAFMAVALCTTSCDVHEFPDAPDKVPFHLRLHYDTDMVKWYHNYKGGNVVEEGFGDTTQNVMPYGAIRYDMRVFPYGENQRSTRTPIDEFAFQRNIADGYDCAFDLHVVPGRHTLKIWSDLSQDNNFKPGYYNASNFSEITLAGSMHYGNTDWRDAFRGTDTISLSSGILETLPDTMDIVMKRPLAKYEFITTDLQAFFDNEIDYLTQLAATRGELAPTRVDVNNYKVVFYYSGFMPNAYNIHNDKPVDSALGVLFESKLNVLGSAEASLGFDYVFVNGSEAGVSVQIGLYDTRDNRQIALSNPINVPLRRSHHTIIRGSFLLQQASGGLVINPEFDGNHNVIIP